MDEHGDSFSDQRPSSGTIVRIRLENFMCHSNLDIEFGDWVNFITGQNGSKSLCTKSLFKLMNWPVASFSRAGFLLFSLKERFFYL